VIESAEPAPPPFQPRSGSKRLRQPNVMDLVTSIQPRDLNILIDVYDKKILTTHHITDIYFDSARCARRRLLHLYRYGLLDRFRPQAERGSAPEHYVLAKGGGEIVAAYLGEELRKVYDKDRVKKLAYSPFLDHLVAINTFYSRLKWACRHCRGCSLEWLGERRTWDSWRGIVFPDGFGRIKVSGRSLIMFLELDRGTEPLNRISAKLDQYRIAAQSTEDEARSDHPDLLLFCLPTPAREANARKVLHSIGMTIATTWFQNHVSDPLGAIWLPLMGQERVPLPDLPVETPTDAGPEVEDKAGGSS
jgi:hypothetical protein